MKNEFKKHKFELILNNIKHDIEDPTKSHASFIIMDTTKSLNNVMVTEDTLMDAKASILGMPIVTKFNKDELDFGTHEEFLDEDLDGNQFVNRDTIAIGSFTTEGYMKDLEIDGETKRVFMADGVLWRSRYKDAVELLESMIREGKTIPMSNEYLYANHSFIDGVEIHHTPIFFEGHAILGQNITPAYQTARVASIDKLQEFNRLVASAINQNKEVSKLPTEEKELKFGAVDKILNEAYDSAKKQLKVQTNESVEEAVENLIDAAQEVVDKAVEVEDAVEAKEQEDEVTSKIEEVETADVENFESITNELKDQVSQLNSKIEELVGEKAEIASKLESATETISQLNAQLEELKEIKQQIMNAEKEVKLEEARNKYSKALNANLFEDEKVQELITNSIEDGEVGVNAKLALSELILEQVNAVEEKVEVKEEAETQFNAKAWVASLNASKREFKELEKGEDLLAEFRS